MSTLLAACKSRNTLFRRSFEPVTRWLPTPVTQHRCLASQASDPTSEEKRRLATIRLYRIIQRSCRSFDVKSRDDPILLQPVLDAPDWGRHMVFRPPSPTMIEELYRLFYVWNDEANDEHFFEPSSIDDWYSSIMGSFQEESLPPMTSMTCWTSTKQLQQAIRMAFRSSYGDVEIPSDLHMWIIRAIQQLQEQQRMWSHSSVADTEGVRVTATSRCIGTTTPASSLPPSSSSDMLENKYRFAYRIRVENLSEDSVQLLGRYWCIQELNPDGTVDAGRAPVVVDAPATGAVGHLPVLQPGQVFQYMSGTDLATSRGVMDGHFYMARVPSTTMSAKSGDHVEALGLEEKMEVNVAPFPLEAI